MAYIYVSIDLDRNNWISASEELGITELQFRIIDNSTSPLIDYLKIGLIPRYIFQIEEGYIINLYGKSPLKEHLEYYNEIFSR